MASRLELQTKLEELLGSRNVYFNPPESLKMQYDAIRYSRRDIDKKYANNTTYMTRKCYELILISRDPDNPLVDKILALPYCSYDRQYYADNLSHDVFTLYY